jgi:hypothetical protein
MSRTRLLQLQGATRRDGQTMAAAVTHFSSKGDDAVRNRVGPLD